VPGGCGRGRVADDPGPGLGSTARRVLLPKPVGPALGCVSATANATIGLGSARPRGRRARGRLAAVGRPAAAGSFFMAPPPA
jgi:hypothetical protein